MNKANKIDVRYSVAQAIQRNWQRSLGLSEKDITCLFSKSYKVQEWCNKMLGWYCFSMAKLETWIYIPWFWLQIVMVSPGSHLVKNTESQIKKKYLWGLCVTRQLIWLISLTHSKTLYYCGRKSKSEQICAFSEQIYAFLFYNSFQHKKPFR